MDWLKELLKKLGIAESDVDKIDGEISKELPKHFVPKTQYNDLSEAKKKLETDLTERDKQLEGLGKTAGASEELKKQIAQLQDENKQAAEEYQNELKELRTNTALKLALSGKVHDPDLVVGLLDKAIIELDESGTVKAGFDDQLKALQESKAFLFVQEQTPQFRGMSPADGSSGGGGGQQPNLGKQLAEQNKQAGAAMQEAQANYFK